MEYKDFIKSKVDDIKATGFTPTEISDKLFDFQRDIVRWALQKGKAAIFAGTGLGKTLMQCEWARSVCEHEQGNVLILAPLAVSNQTVNEAAKFGIKVNYCKGTEDVKQGINITNYERLDKFDASDFAGVVLDESSILKALSGKTKQEIIDKFYKTPYKLACTATPSPNDYMELGNHSEFLGVMKSKEMLAMYFVHDGGEVSKWRLKGHAVNRFWEWVASWAVMLTRPSDIGYDDDRYNLPALRIHQIVVESETVTETLFPVEAKTLKERQTARRNSIEERAKKCAELCDEGDQWLIWCNLNDEGEALRKSISGSIEVRGSDSVEEKEKNLNGFSEGRVKVLITKPSIAGFGMNWQNCNKMAFVGLSDSFEQYYQAVRRCWRFGQEKPVDVYIITADTEGAVKANIEKKERAFEQMQQGMIAATQELTRKNIGSKTTKSQKHTPDCKMILPEWIKGA